MSAQHTWRNYLRLRLRSLLVPVTTLTSAQLDVVASGRILEQLTRPSYRWIRRTLRLSAAALLGTLTTWLAADGLPASITGTLGWIIAALAGAIMFVVGILVLNGCEREQENPEAIPAGQASALKALRIGYVWALGAVAVSLLVTPFVGFSNSFRIVFGALLLFAPGYFLSVVLLPASQGFVGRVLLGGVLSAGVVPTAVASLNGLGVPFSGAVALASTAGPTLLLVGVILGWPRLASGTKWIRRWLNI